MVLKTSSHATSLDFLQTALASNPPSHKQQNFFTNHQKWQISRQLDCESGSPIFHLINPYGTSYTAAEFVVENLDPEFGEALGQLTSPEQQQLVHEYLQKRLDQATSYRIHVERHGDKLFLRFGDYGLKGGMQGNEKAGALLFSVAQIGLGLRLIFTGGNAGMFAGTLISAGFSSGLYAYQTVQYRHLEYVMQAMYGALAGLITGTFGKLAHGASAITRIGLQVLGSAASSATSTVVSEVVESIDKKKELRLQELLRSATQTAISGGIGGGVGALMGSFTNAALTSEAVNSFVHQFMEEFSDDLATGILILKKMAESGVSSGSSRFAAGFYENSQERDSTKKKNLKTQTEEAFQSAFIGAAISGITTCAEQAQKIAKTTEFRAATQTAQKAQQSLDQLAFGIEKDIHQHLKHGHKAKIGGRYTKNEEKIRNAYLEGRKIKWEKGEHNWGFHRKAPIKNYKTYQLTQEYAQQHHTIQGLQFSINQMQTGLKIADNKLSQQPTRQYLHLLSRGALKKALKTEPVSYVETDCNLEELIPHVVLVHALNHQSPHESIAIEMVTKCQNEEERIAFYVEKVVTFDGSIGNHLQLKEKEFCGALVDRPHIHWAWNQLVQPNGHMTNDGPLNSWEQAKIAFLEPLSTFENGLYHKPFGVTPYDTFTFHSHRFSEKSIILAPRSVVDKVKIHLTGFRGRIVPYDDNEVLRSAVINALQKYYPETWHICDAEGNLTGKQMRYTKKGYRSQTCIKKTDGKVIVLINKSGYDADTEHKSEAIKEWHKDRRFIGLHIKSKTFWLEDKKYFKSLKKIKEKHETVKDNPLFAGSVNNIEALTQLGTLTALEFYQESLKYDLKTGIAEVARYIINEAIYADLESLFYQTNPTAKFELSVLDLTMIFESTHLYLLNLLENIKTHIESQDPTDKQKAMQFFESALSKDPSYCSILRQSLIDIQKAKEETLKMVTKIKTENTPSEKKTKPLCLVVAQDKWEKIEAPADSLAFDLGKNWPYSDQLRKYANKVLRTLPTDSEKLLQLYQQVSSFSYPELRTLEERKEQYRLNIICSMIQWALQEKLYLASREEYTAYGSILANKLSKQIGWLAEYGLETEDFTLKIGDCLFDNIVAQLPGKTPTSLQLRKELVGYMQKNSEAYSEELDYNDTDGLCVGDGEKSLLFENWQQYLTCMNQPQVWGTELEIQALASYLDCPIVLLTVGMQPKIYNSESKNYPLFLHHLNDNHFESCIPFKGLATKDVYNGIKNQPHF
ncbi:MAG TPA: hypothetical protein VFU89_00890 [Rhabdochlamydiaceae bacterium]|nr:hypothetical protein [Rhabdochlamydiaceae bacterium]